MNLKFKIIIIMVAINIIGAKCKKEDYNERCTSCEKPLFVQTFKNINGEIRKVVNLEYRYNNNQFYILVDAEISLPQIYTNINQKYVKLFSCSASNYTDVDIGKTVQISGNLFNCTTANHGAPTNNLHTFLIYNN
ncbi:hypothetical protein FYC62_14550 [Pedobacter aquae]|uniref:Uncharacterized protein n=2 Tax=Pedobacter aquae TaxID=2605747 RepID=A0A5C0VLG8_9SPHI|nr:hypothetical protein FYC62_14550 [Pedobacter aquae]